MIEQQIRKSLRDPRMVALAAAIAMGERSFVLHDDLEWSEAHRAWLRGGSGATRELRLPGGPPLLRNGEILDDAAFVERVFWVVKRNVDYVTDDKVIDELVRRGYIARPERGYKPDVFMTAALVLLIGKGDCDDHTIVHLTLLGIAHFRVALDVISTDGQEWVHIFGRVGLPRRHPRQLVALDTAAPEANSRPYVGWEVPNCNEGAARGVCAQRHWTKQLSL